MLREERIASMLTLQEFMMRRFEPAMRTREASEARLRQITKRTERAGNLLRTRVEVQRSMQNQGILKSLDKRANIQLKMQKTVEGLSVVAISYYAVNLLGGLLVPIAKTWNMNKYTLIFILTIPVVLVIWFMITKIKNKHFNSDD